jgi:hypothetical protein
MGLDPKRFHPKRERESPNAHDRKVLLLGVSCSPHPETRSRTSLPSSKK